MDDSPRAAGGWIFRIRGIDGHALAFPRGVAVVRGLRQAASAGEPGCPVALEDLGTATAAACGIPAQSRPTTRANEEHFYVSRSELVQVVEDVLRARGLG